MFDHPIRKTLANGLRLVWEYRPSYESAAVTCLVGAGSRHDFAKRPGLAHFVEHAILQTEMGGEESPPLRAILDAGGAVDAETGLEATAFHIYSHKDDALGAVRSFARILGRIPQNPEFLVREKAVIREELNIMGEDNPMDPQRVKFALLGADEDLRHSVGGSHRALKRFTLEDIATFYHQFYVARNMVLGIVGNLNPEESLGEVESLFGACPSGEAVGGTNHFEVAKGPRIRFQGNVPHCAVFAFFHCPDRGSESLGALELLAETYVGGPHSRLYTRLREQEALVYGIESQFQFARDLGTFDLVTSTERRNVTAVVRGVLEEAGQLANEPIPDDAFQVLVRQMVKRRLLQFESPAVAADWYAFRELFAPDDAPGNLPDWIRDIERLTPGDLARVAREVFAPENLFVYVLGGMNIFRRRRLRSIVKRFGRVSA